MRTRRVLKLSLACLLALIVLLALGAGVYVWRSFPTLDGELRAAGLAAPVQVRRDASDVTHIEAQSLADAYFALGYVHAQERGWQLEFNRRLMHGQLSELFGESTLETDRTLRRLGIVRAAQAQWERMPAAEQQLLAAYARGINNFHASSAQALPPEFHILRTRPGEWTPQDSVAWALVMALDLSANWGQEFARLSALQRLSTAELWQLMPPYPGEAPATRVDLAALYRGLGVYREPEKTSSATERAQLALAGPDAAAQPDEWRAGIGWREGIGSNNWVVAGSRTASGKPLLANDPHLGLNAPAIWYFARIKAPAAPGGRPTDVIGATLPGAPGVVLGRTAGVAWGFTNTTSDAQDLYLEQIHPDHPDQYRTPDGWARFEQREETIKVKGRPDEKLLVRITRHGPVVSDANAAYADLIDTRRYALALRWVALDADNPSVRATLQANFAQTVDELLAAFADFHAPMQSVVAADTQGRTAFQAIGRVPVRSAGDDLRGMAPAPGWEAKYDWQGLLPAADNPRADSAQIEARGWLATANHRIHPADFPHFMGQDWITPERFERIEALLAATPRHDAASFARVQADTVSLTTQRLLPLLRAARSDHALAAAAQAQLQHFDGDMRADRSAPLIVTAWTDELTRGIMTPKLGAAKFKALYGKRSLRAGLHAILDDPQAARAWCAPQTCEQQSSASLGRALDRLSAAHGADVAAWRWGQAHPAISSHRPFGNVAALARFFDVTVPTGGDSWTVNVGQYSATNAGPPFANRLAPSLRAIYDLADLEKSQFIYQTGQSGLVFSPRYRDMAQAWARVEYRPLQMAPSAWTHQATLTPAR